MTTIKFYSGMKTIGGTVIAVQNKQHRIIFDFGYIANSIFDDVLKPRLHCELKDKLALGMLPEVEGIFPEANIDGANIEAYETSNLETIFFISHMHLDHMASLSDIDSRIPIYMSKESKLLYEALASINEEVPINNLVGLDYEETFDFGPFKLKVMPVDHDVQGASALSIETPDGQITYSGDIRFHGFTPEHSHRFIEASKHTDVLITEGVSISFIDEDTILEPNPGLPEGAHTEQSLIESFEEVLLTTKGIVFFNVYHRNLQRLFNLIDLSSKCHRTIVLEPETALLLSRFSNRRDYYVIDHGYSNDHPLQRDASFSYIDIDTINANPIQYMMQMSYPYSISLLDLCIDNGAYIHSNGAPLGDYDPAYGRLISLLDKLNLLFISIACGGHAHPEQLKYLVETIEPRCLVPYHSFAPERLTNDKGDRILPEAGDLYQLEDGILIKATHPANN